jgi:hypothetical protein
VRHTRCWFEKQTSHCLPDPLEQPLRTFILETIAWMCSYASYTEIETVPELLRLNQNDWSSDGAGMDVLTFPAADKPL